MSGKGSTSNVIAGLASFFIPGLGQLVQGRMLKALIHVVIGVIIWIISIGMLGWVIHIWSAYEAATHKE